MLLSTRAQQQQQKQYIYFLNANANANARKHWGILVFSLKLESSSVTKTHSGEASEIPPRLINVKATVLIFCLSLIMLSYIALTFLFLFK